MNIALILLAVGVILFLLWIWNRQNLKNFPPGPIGFPVVGYFPFLGKQPYKTLAELGKKYGNIFSVRLGTTNVVVLNDWPAIKEALIKQGDIFTGRPKNIVYETMFGNNDLSFSDGLPWKDRRRFTIRHLRNLGMGKSSLENIIVDEINDLMQRLNADNKKIKAIRIDNYFFLSFLRIIWSIVGGKMLECNNEFRNELLDIVKSVFDGASNTNPLFYMPYLSRVFPKKFNTLRSNIKKFNEFLQNTVSQHMASYQEDNLRDFVDVGLKEVFHRQNSPQNASVPFTRDNIVEICKDLFVGGSDTSTSTLSWGLLYVAVWPSIQQKVQKELDDVIGRERLPTYKDKTVLSYCNAVVLEILRYSTIAPLSVLRTTTQTTKLFGYTLPKRTFALPNLWAVHFDPEYWGDPDVFRPERFLDENGKIRKPEYFIPFAVGGRDCPGRSLAEMNVFLFFTSFLHRFTFSLIPGEKLPDFEPIYALTLSPQPFSLLIQQR